MSIIDNAKPRMMVDTHVTSVFPADFLWGAATASYQIEGAAYEDGRGLSIWDQFAAIPGKVHQGENGDVAADHYHRMPEDVALMAELGLNAYRFSIAWPRILPRGKGTVNGRGLDFYDRLVDTLLARGITPLVTLYHWDLPLALHEKGGWLNRETAFAFADYAEVVARQLGDRVDWWVTLNEPWCSAYLGYGNGKHAPGIRDKWAAYTAAHHLLLAHGLALPRLRAYTRKSTQLGITLNLTPIYAANEHPRTLRAAAWADKMSNRWFHDPIKFYEHVTSADSSYTEMGWEVYPQALTDVLVRVHHDYAPRAIVVTENGAAFADQWDGSNHLSDPQRLHYIRDHILALEQAQPQGIDYRLNPDLKGLHGLALMDRIIQGARSRGLKIILDRHDPTADLRPQLWYTDQVPASRWIHDWVMLARHYRGNDTVIGADLANEPHGPATWGDGNPRTDWRLAAEQAGNAILAVNADWLIIVEGIEQYH